MNVWVLRDLEPLPIDPGGRRLMRAGLLSRALAEAGHQTTWIVSNFDHYRHRMRPMEPGEIGLSENLRIRMLAGPGYRRNIGLARIRHNRCFARAFLDFARASPDLPDVLVTDIPTTEAAAAAIGFARERGIASVLSIRDPWPDSFATHLPPVLGPVAPLLIAPFQRQVRIACAHATSLVGTSRSYLDWALRKGARTPSDTDAVFPLAYMPPRGITEEETREQLATWGIDPDRRVVSFVGSWGKSVDLGLVAETARRLADRRDWTFVIAGAPPGPAAGSSPFDHLPNVVLTGWIDARQIAILLGRSDIGLLPYAAHASQSLPNKFFEYMAHGCFQLSTLPGETAQFYERSGTGRRIPGTAAAFAEAIIRRLDGGDGQPRDRIAREFARHYSAREIHDGMVRHIEGIVAHGRAGARNGAGPYSIVKSASKAAGKLTVTCHHLSPEVAERVRAWFRGDITDFKVDGERSVRFAHPGLDDHDLKIKGAGYLGREIRFGQFHRSRLKAPVFDFDGRMMEDVASGHDNAFLGGASFQQAVTEYAIGARLSALGYDAVPVLGYGSVSRDGMTSWFSVFEWEREMNSIAPPRATIDAFAEANLFYGHQALELARRHGLIGYFWYAATPGGSRRLKDLHPFRQADPVNMSRISWVMQVFFCLHTVALSTIHLVRRAGCEAPGDIQALLFRAILPTVTAADHEALRKELVAPYMIGPPADFDPGRLQAVLERHALTAALLELCPDEFTPYRGRDASGRF